jgi:ribosome-associated protein
VIRVSPSISLSESELQFDFIRASGPGGQNVNKVSTAVQVRFDVNGSDALPEGVRQRLIKLAGSRMTNDGVLILTARRHRTQERNKQDGIDRLVQMIQEAASPPRRRKKTRPTRASKERRLKAKKARGDTKQGRNRPPTD